MKDVLLKCRDLPGKLLLESVDPRIYACVRIAFAVVSLVNLMVLWPQRDIWLTDSGMIDQDLMRQCYAWPYLTVFSLCEDHLSVSAYMLFSAAAMVLLMLGIQPRLAAIAVFVWHVSYTARCALALGGWEPTLRAVSFLVMCSPLPLVWSLQRPKGNPLPLRQWPPSYGITLIRMQVLVIYWQTVLDRLESPFWLNGEFMGYYLLSHNARWPGFWAADWDLPLRVLTFLILLAEIALPVMLMSRRWYRHGLLLGVALHAGIYIMSINLGMFLLAMLMLYTAFLRSADIDAAAAWIRRMLNSRS